MQIASPSASWTVACHMQASHMPSQLNYSVDMANITQKF